MTSPGSIVVTIISNFFIRRPPMALAPVVSLPLPSTPLLSPGGIIVWSRACAVIKGCGHLEGTTLQIMEQLLV
jgi:hypothetical protein